ncbi:hypothetical protein [Paractinoplanes hotanensis]|uniref:Uncharacterized protein n=1 Tax=Paractinoplanes hotanensis TaxID=2906497 RepID=A0ABT0YAL4_9ACTN|nr:hypothetical protein [Actinoplanes hotanensis]MCM4083080.1 hypothetical protein [Actinoplanes hotanensis]
MGELAERLSLLVVEAASPDGDISATARGPGDVRIGFAPGAYRRYRAAVLARQVEALATALWVRYRRRYLEIVSSWTYRDEEPEPTDEDRDFQRQLADLQVTGVSARGRVIVRSRALVSWHVEIAGEPVGSLTESEFLAELGSAVAALLADHRAKVTLLTDAVYDIGLPRAMRTAG